MGDDQETTKSLDAAALELAQAALAEEPELAADQAEELSNDILDMIDEWIETKKGELPEKETASDGESPEEKV